MFDYYQLTVPVYTRALKQLSHILDKAAEYAAAKQITDETMLGLRLAPDMFNFVQQVQYVCFLAIEIMGPLSGKTPPTLTYDEKTISDCIQSLNTTIKYVESITPRDIARTKVKTITVFWGAKKRLKTQTYLERVGIPDFFFHVVTAYGILRHKGVPIGKDDFLGTI
jgi:hypothetical protein